MGKKNKLISAVSPLQPVQIIDLSTGEIVPNHDHDNSVTQLIEYVTGRVRAYCGEHLEEISKDLLSDQRKISPAEWGRQHGYRLSGKEELAPDILAKSRIEKLYQHKLVSEVASYVRNPNPRKQVPGFAPKINLGAVDKQMCKLTINDQQLCLDFKMWDKHYLLVFNIPRYLFSRDIVKWSLPVVELRRGKPYYVFSIEERIPSRQASKNTAGLDLGRVEPYTLVVVNRRGARIADYTTSPRVKRLNGKRERILVEKKYILTKADHYDKLGLDSSVLRREAKFKARKALLLGDEIARQVGADVSKKLSKHDISLIHVEDLSWVTGKKYGSKWSHSKTQSAITHALTRKGISVRKVNPKNTSQHCHKCKTLIVHNTRKRTVYCVDCKIQLDRDYNAAMNIAKTNTNSYPAPQSKNGNKPSHTRQLVETTHNSVLPGLILTRMTT